MIICNNINQFLELYLDKFGKYKITDLSFDDNNKWNELLQYCIDNCGTNPELYYVIANAYRYGKGIEQDIDRSVNYAQIGIKNNSIRCLWFIGGLYRDGIYYEQSYTNAFEYYLKAAEAGCIPCMYNVGLYYKRGRGISQDFNMSLYWFEKAAKLEDIDSCAQLAEIYEKGLGVEQSYIKAIYWYEIAAEQGNKVAQYNLAALLDSGKVIKQDSTKAAYWYEKAALQGDADAQYRLGILYYKGQGIIQDYIKAVYWFEKAADQGKINAIKILGLMYYKDEEIEQDLNKAVYWYLKAASLGDADSQYMLGLLYYKGQGVPQDYEQAVDWYKISAEQGNMYAQYNLALMYEKGLGLPLDNIKSAYWYEKSANQGNSSAQVVLSLLYFYGDVLEKDLNKSLQYAKAALSSGFEPAREVVEEIEKYLESISEENIISYGNLQLGKRKDVFISWNHNDKVLKDDLVKKLDELGFNSCFDSDGDGHGELLPVLMKAIRDSKAAIILVTKNSIKSNWVKQEVSAMLQKANENPVYKEAIKPILISDNDGDIVELINKLEDASPFKELLSLGGQFETAEAGIDANNIKKFVVQAIDKALKLEYKDKVIKEFQSFSASLKNTYSTQNTQSGIISAMIDFDSGYIDRSVYKNEKPYQVNDILSETRPILIYGEGGCGKSLYLKNIVRKAFEKNNYIFFLETKKIINELDNSIDFLKIIKSKSFDNYYPNYQSFITDDSFEDIFNNNNELYILIDALDEIDDFHKNILFEKIFIFKNKYTKLHFIFTSRNSSDNQYIEKAFNTPCSIYAMKGLNNKEVEALYNTIYQNYKENNDSLIRNSKDFISKIDEINDEIKRNPLLVSNLIFVYLLSNQFPNTRYELVNKTVDIMIKDIEDDRAVLFKYKDFLTENNLTKLLSELAYTRASGDTSPITEIFKDVIAEIDSSLDSDSMSVEIYKYLKNRAILTEDNLSHEIFKDYFTATSIYDDIYIKTKQGKKRRIIFKEFGFETLQDVKEDFTNEENPWPGVSCDFIAKLDYNIKASNDNETNEAFKITIDYLLTHDNLSVRALEILKLLIERKSLYFYEFIKKFIQ